MKPTIAHKLELLARHVIFDHPPLSPSRLLDVPGVHNIRDLGGLPTRYGRIKRTKVFRSAQPGSITPAGADILRELGISTIFDLRSLGESDAHDSSMRVKNIAGIKRVATPVFAFQGQGQGRPGKSTRSRCESYATGEIGFRKEYRDILAAGGPAFRPILLHLRNNPASGCLFHCTLGRDRTGILAAVILSLVGVDDATIEKDFCLSAQGLSEWRPALEGILWRQEPGLFGLEEKKNIFSVRYAHSFLRALEASSNGANKADETRGSSIRATLEFMRVRYGSVEGYVKSCCELGERDIEAMRGNLLERSGV